MKPREFLIFAASILGLLALRGAGLFGPFVLPFETAFQEAIALHHLENGLVANRFLPVFATIDGVNFYHTAHPPLLHVIYYVLYEVFGVWEVVTRGFSLALLAASSLLWRELAGGKAKWGFAVFPLAFLLPLSLILGTTTNYEPLSILMITLIGYAALRRRADLPRLLILVTAGMLVDWPAYLAAPALLIVRWPDRKARRTLLIVVVYEAVFFLALQAFQYAVAGEAAFFSHAPTRANPMALLALSTWRDLISHYRDLMGTPLALVGAAAVAAWLPFAGSSYRALNASLSAGKEEGAGPGPGGAALYFAVHLGLLLLFAPGLVSRHYVHLLYLTPLLIFTIMHALQRVASPGLALAALLVLTGSRDYLAALDRNPAYFALATNYRMYPAGGLGQVKSVFSSSAIGAWKFYADVETVFPMSAAAAKWIETNSPDLLHLDLRHGEVGSWSETLLQRDSYALLVTAPGEAVYLRGGGGGGVAKRPGRIGYVEARSGPGGPRGLFMVPGRQRVCLKGIDRADPEDPFLWAETSVDCLDPVYALEQRPGPGGRGLTVTPPSEAGSLHLEPALVHPLPFARSDGVNFLVLRGSDSGEAGKRLIYARFVQDGPAETRERSVRADLGGAGRLSLVTLPGPRLNQAFDDAFWIEPYYLYATKE